MNSTQPALPPAATTVLARARRNGWLLGMLLMVMACGVYLPALQGGYVVDDDIYVTQNRTLRSADGLRRIWCKIGAEPDYYAMVYSTFWLEYHLWGLAPLGYHAVNVALHALGALLLWRLLVRLRVPGAWLAAAIFAVHPVCVESIAWITERKNTLSLLLALASMLCYLRFEPAEIESASTEPGRRGWRFYAAALVLFTLALLSKTAVVALPAVLLVVYWWKRGTIRWRTTAPLLPLFLLACAMGVLTIWVETYINGTQGADWSFSPLERVLIAGRTLWFYADKLVWPHPLAFFYPRWTIDSRQWWQYLYPAAAVATLGTLWFARNKIGRGPLAAVLIFAGVLLPVLGFVNTCYMRCYFVADHLQYQAAAAVIALATAAICTVVNRFGKDSMRSMAVAAAALLLGTFATLSWRQCLLYADPITLNEDTLAKNPDSWTAHNNLGIALLDLGKPQDAAAHYEAALRIRPNFPEAENNLGYALLVLGKSPEAMEHFQQALRVKPDYAAALCNIGNVLRQSGRLQEASQQYEADLRIKPDSFEAHNNLGIVLQQFGKQHEAIEHFHQALNLEPDFPEVHNNLGNSLLKSGQSAEAIEQYQLALQLKENYLEAAINLATAYARTHQLEASFAAGQRALNLARSSGQTQQADKIETWLNARRAALAVRPNAPVLK
jgi:protein O-mannosyl-transferase